MSHRTVIEAVVPRELFIAVCLESAGRSDLAAAKVMGWSCIETEDGDLQVLLVVETSPPPPRVLAPPKGIDPDWDGID